MKKDVQINVRTAITRTEHCLCSKEVLGSFGGLGVACCL